MGMVFIISYFRFPNDEKTYAIDRQFLLGKILLVTPVLEQGVSYVVGYFPKGLWYDLFTVRKSIAPLC